MGPDGNCAVLHINVGPNDGCNAFEDTGQAGAPPPTAGMPPMGGGPPPGPPMGGGFG
jgi:hypothetical protein